MKILEPDNMVKVRAVSPLDLAEALDAWGAATQEADRRDRITNASGGPLPEQPLHPLLEHTGLLKPTDEEINENRRTDYSKRICAGLFEWLKEV